MNRQEKSKLKGELLNLEIQTRRKENINKELIDFGWVIKITIITFFISLSLSALAEGSIPNVPIIGGIFLVILFIVVGVLFDIIGVAVTVSDEKVFHSMASRKVKGAKLAVKFKKSTEKVSSFCNDVIGDICGVISGTAGATIAISISSKLNVDVFLTSLLVTSTIAALTIGGKAIGKSYAINKSNIILFKFSKFISNFYNIK